MNRDQTIDLIKTMCRHYAARKGSPPKVVIVVGGTAMVLHGFRPQSEDVDLFATETAMETVAAEIEVQSGIHIDVTRRNTLWGELRIPDIESDAEIVSQVDLNGTIVDIAAISPATLFILKAASLRDKDHADLQKIMPPATPASVLARMAALWPYQTQGRHAEVAHEALVNLVDEILVLKRSGVEESWLSDVPDSVRQQWGPLLTHHFGALFPSSPPGVMSETQALMAPMKRYTNRAENQTLGAGNARVYTLRKAFHDDRVILVDEHTGFKIDMTKARFERDFVEFSILENKAFLRQAIESATTALDSDTSAPAAIRGLAVNLGLPAPTEQEIECLVLRATEERTPAPRRARGKPASSP
ncbi:MAG: DUF6036 family nucleotidyltransferase [Acidobacteriaceae bacterium]